MGTNRKADSDPTVEYYNKNANAFIERSRTADLNHAYARFLAIVPSGGRVLDAGCGSGRDSKYFIEKGFDVEAFDASREMVKFASDHAGVEVQHLRFDQIRYNKEFDAVWASASLLHVPKDDIQAVLHRLILALMDGGVLYLSVKVRESITPAGGRCFYYYTPNELEQLLSSRDDAVVLDTWIKEEEGCLWANAMCRREQSG
ncbi:MAG: methyltransferase domain-containing protein [Phycisphaerales bacterium]|nr:methyltransferase domain-containing protein [Phycisphaerales bacterium]